MTLNHFATELNMLYWRLFEYDVYSKPNALSDYTRNGEHNSCVWLMGHIGFIADDMILRPWSDNGKHSLITETNFGYSSNGKVAPTLAMSDVADQVKDIFRIAKSRLAEDSAEMYLSSRSSFPGDCATDKHLVIHGIQDIAYHSGQLGYILTGKTVR